MSDFQNYGDPDDDFDRDDAGPSVPYCSGSMFRGSGCGQCYKCQREADQMDGEDQQWLNN